MSILKSRIIVSSLALVAAACAHQAEEVVMETQAVATGSLDEATLAQLGTNPLLAEWDGPYGGVPDFAVMDLDWLPNAMEAGMAAELAEIDAIANNEDPPTFENVIVAMQRTGEPLGRAYTFYGLWSSNLSSPEFREIDKALSPKLAAHSTAIIQNEKLYARIKALWAQRDTLDLTPEEARLLKMTYERFFLSGADLDAVGKLRYAAINQQLAELSTSFSNNLLADEEGWVTYFSEQQAGGLPKAYLAAAKVAAEERGQASGYAVVNTRSSMDPFLTYATDRKLREVVWSNYYNRGNNGDAHDNNEIIVKTLQLRNERIKLLGYDTYADWQLTNRMAKTPGAATELMETVWAAAVERAHEEVADMQKLADLEKAGITIQPWDYRYYAEKVRKDRYDLDSDEVKQYLQLDKLREAMFFVAGEFFGFAFAPVTDGSLPVFHEDVKVWEVTDKASGDHIGYWYLDPFARTGKRSGAWATTYRSHSTYDGQDYVLASNNSNFVEPAPGEAVLVSLDDAETFFHEFGHALHYLSANVKYPGSNGGVRDYTEFHSQLLERWVLTQEVIDNYLTHVDTGEPMPASLVAKIRKAGTFNQGFETVEFLGSAIMDMRYHALGAAALANLDVQAFEKAELEALGMPREIPMRHRSTQFGHIFSSEGYAAGYYGYLWADVLTADAAEAFQEAPGGYYDKDVAERIVRLLYAPRNAVDPAEAYREFRGRDATSDALMRARGFAPPLEK